jgi:frataxin-like iron-binding protein CyaY
LTEPAAWIQHGSTFAPGHAQYADVDGDGKADLIFQGANNQFWVSKSNGASFDASTPQWVQHGGTFTAGEAQYADVNGDGKADLIYQGKTNAFYVSLSTGNGFTDPAQWMQHGGSFEAGHAQYADVDGDGKADLIFQGANNQFWVSKSNGSSFDAATPLWVQHGGSFVAGEAQYADLNGDGKADLLYQGKADQAWESLSTGTGFTAPVEIAHFDGTFQAGQFKLADVSGDHRADFLMQTLSNQFLLSLNGADFHVV